MGLYPDIIIIKPQSQIRSITQIQHFSWGQKMEKKKKFFNTQISVVKPLGDKPLSKIRFLQKNWP